MKLLITVESKAEWRWLEAFDFLSHGIDPLVLHYTKEPSASWGYPHRSIAHEIHEGETKEVALPDFAEIVRALENERASACFFMSDGPLARLTSTAADLLEIPVSSLLSSPLQLSNLRHHAAEHRELAFLTDSRLFPQALDDHRYGATLLPTGHPGRDLHLKGIREDPAFESPHFGDGLAAGRILTGLRQWQGKQLPPAPELSVIVPAYNESANVELVCDRLVETLDAARIPAEILLIDDSSSDGTYEVALRQMWRSPRILALSKPLPRGMGNAIRFGLRRARAPILAVTMGDGSDDVAKIPEMFDRVKSGDAALAIGSRYRHRRNYQNVPRLYRFWSRCFRLTARILLGLKLQDSTNSFRVYHRDIFARYGPEGGGFEISPETTFKAWFATRKVVEVDVFHLKRASGQSSFSFLRAGPGYGKMVAKALVHRLTGRWFTLDW